SAWYCRRPRATPRRSSSSSATSPTRRRCGATGPSSAIAASTPTRRSPSGCSTGDDAGRARLPHAGGVGAARRHRARLAARAERPAGQVHRHPMGLRRGRPPPRLRRARAHPRERCRHGAERPARPRARRRRPGPRRVLPRADRPLVDARLLPALRAPRRRRGRPHQLEAQRLGDDTHGHVDDLARFVDARTVVVASEEDPTDPNYDPLRENRERLARMTDQDAAPVRVVELPMPAPVVFDGERLPASYANFYVANAAVLVPTFNDPRDRQALETLAELFPGRRVVG